MRITKEEVRKQLKAYMKKHDLKQYELAAVLGIAQTQVWRWLNCKCELHKGSIAILKIKGILKEEKE